MNDWYLDPSEEPEPPECDMTECDGYYTIPIGWVNLDTDTNLDWQVLICDECGDVGYLEPDRY